MSASNKDLLDSEKILSHAVPAAFLIKKDDDGSMVFERCEGLLAKELKISGQKVRGKNPVQFFSSETMRNNLLRAFSGVSSSFDFRFKRRLLNCTLEPCDDFGEVASVVGTLLDVTEARRSERRQLMFIQTINSLNESVSITDNEDVIVYVNPAFTELYGYSEDEIVGQPSSKLWSELNSDELTSQILPGTMNGGWSGYLYNKHKEQGDFMIYLRTSVVQDNANETVGFVGVASKVDKGALDDLPTTASVQKPAATEAPPHGSVSVPAFTAKIDEEEANPEFQFNPDALARVFPEYFYIEESNPSLQNNNFLWYGEQLDRVFLAMVESDAQDAMSLYRSLMISGLLDQIVNGSLISLPDQVLNKLNQVLAPFLALNYSYDGTAPTVNIGFSSLTKNHKTFRFAGANLHMLHYKNGKLRLVEGSEAPLAAAQNKEEGQRYFKIYNQNMEHGESIYLFTQSIVDQIGELGEPLGVKGLKDFLLSIATKHMSEQEEEIKSFFQRWRGSEEAFENLLFLGLRF